MSDIWQSANKAAMAHLEAAPEKIKIPEKTQRGGMAEEKVKYYDCEQMLNYIQCERDERKRKRRSKQLASVLPKEETPLAIGGFIAEVVDYIFNRPLDKIAAIGIAREIVNAQGPDLCRRGKDL